MKTKHLSKDQISDVSAYLYDLDVQNSQKLDPKVLTRLGIQDVHVKVKCLNVKQKELKKAIENKDIVISVGPAGTGRTYMSLLTGLHLLKTEPRYKQLKLVKSLQTIPGESVGYLPGDLEEKLNPHMYSFTGNLDKIFGAPEITRELKKKNIIEYLPIAYVRGVTIDDSIVIIDEAQNIDLHTFKTIITRIGKNCKMIFLGDIDQIDRKNKAESCLSKVAELFKNVEFAGSVTFTNEDSVRNPIIPKLLEILD